MKRLFLLPIIFCFVGCGSSDEEPTEAEFEASLTDQDIQALYEQCDYAVSIVKNSDELLSCEVALDECTIGEIFGLTFQWTCQAGETPRNGVCPVDENGDLISFTTALSEACQVGVNILEPVANGVKDDFNWMWAQGKLPDSNWCGPGDNADETQRSGDVCRADNTSGDCRGDIINGVDGACRRHDHGNGYNEGGENFEICLFGACSPGLPKAQCGVDRDIVNGSQSQSGNSLTKNAIHMVFNSTSLYPCRAQNQVWYEGGTDWCSCGSWCPGYPCWNSTKHRKTGAKDRWGSDKNNPWTHQQETYKDGCSSDANLNNNSACR